MTERAALIASRPGITMEKFTHKAVDGVLDVGAARPQEPTKSGFSEYSVHGDRRSIVSEFNFILPLHIWAPVPSVQKTIL